MKRIYLIIISFYILIGLYFAAFNWEMFKITLNVDLGFTVVNMPLIISLFLLGILFLLIMWGVAAMYILKMERDLAQKQAEISSLKAEKYDEQKGELDETKGQLSEIRDKTELILSKLGEPSAGKNETNDTMALSDGNKD